VSVIQSSDIRIVIDTREQLPFDFEGLPPDIYMPSEVRTLHTGDYSAVGYEDKIAVERKSLTDLLGCIGNGRDRFQRELERMMDFQFRCVVVEDSWQHFVKPEGGGYDRCTIAPNTCENTIISWESRYGVNFKFCGTRQNAMKYTARYIFHTIKHEEELI
jgi:DNA excision repair protein ERCC-4